MHGLSLKWVMTSLALIYSLQCFSEDLAPVPSPIPNPVLCERVISPAIASPPIAHLAQPSTRGNGELILVVEDIDLLRTLARQNLEKADFKVVTANNGLEAVNIFAEQRQMIRVILLDSSMPVMDGLTALKKLREIDPNVKVILSSGEGPQIERDFALVEDPRLRPNVFLHKPYSQKDLLEVIQKLLAP